MSLYDTERRYKRRFWGRVFRFSIFAGILGLVGLFSYQLGIEDFQSRKASFEAQATSMQDEMDKMASDYALISLEMKQLQDYALDLEARYKKDVPSEEEKETLSLIAAKVGEGVPLDRISLFINSAAEPRECEEASAKRFLVRTPIYSGANTAASFNKDTITVMGDGASVLTEEGAPQAWFDPAKPVDIQIVEIGGKEHKLSGILPLTTSIIREGLEFRFSMKQGARGFVQVTSQQCKAL